VKSRRNLAITLVALAAITASACGPFLGGPAEKTIYVGPYQVDCVGVAPQRCLLVKEDPKDDWTFFYDQIEGFEYEPGYEYELRIMEEKVKDPPADASSIRWILLEVLGKERSLEGTTWVLDAYLNSEGVLISALADGEATATFQAGEIGGNASCNSYFGSYQVRDDKLTINVGGMTEMYCLPEELMAQERDFLATMGQAASYLIAEDKLQIEDLAGAPILTFSALMPAPLVGTLWQLTGYDNGTGGFSSVLRDTEITTTFGDDGNLSGSAGCNNYSTSYEVSGDRLTVGPVASTMMMCPGPQGIMEQESAYLAALQSAATYQIEGQRLTIMNAQGGGVLTYAVREPTPLVGMLWEVMGYNNGKGGVVSVIIGTELTATFGEDGSLTGSAGCNNYAASYDLDEAASPTEGAISIGPAASTRMFCAEPEGTMEQEAQYLAALEIASTYRIEGDRLQLRDENGSLIADYVVKPQVAGLDENALANMEYKSEWTQSGTAPLVNGEYREQAAPGSATETVVMLTPHVAYGELNGESAAAVILVADPGGSGTFYELAVVVQRDGQPVHLASALLGDRIQINALEIVDNAILVDMIAHGPDDPMCCPTQRVQQSYVLEGDQLRDTSGQ
jgi:heat shock protein HslJ